MTQFFGHTLQGRGIRVIQADIRSKVHHQGRLGHIAAYHAGSTYNDKFVFSEVFHS